MNDIDFIQSLLYIKAILVFFIVYLVYEKFHMNYILMALAVSFPVFLISRYGLSELQQDL